MGIEASSDNSTSFNNDTYSKDPFCSDMPLGPIIWSIFSVPSACVGAPSCMWLLWVLIRQKPSSSSNNVYIINITIMDLAFHLIVIPHVLNFFIWQNHMLLYIGMYFNCFNLSGRPMFMTCICVNCYMAVVHPITYMRMKDSRQRLVQCALVWILTLVYGTVAIKKFTIFSTSLGCSALFIVLSHLSILYKLRKPDPSGRSDVHPQKQRAMQTIMYSLIVAVVSYSPPFIALGFNSLINLGFRELICKVFFPTLIFMIVGSAISPLVSLRHCRDQMTSG